MIDHISIKNFAIIKNTEIDFNPGLNIITGETGAGKSIVIEAVSLALGSRADTSYVRTGCDKAVIQLLGESDGEELIITREISASGKNLCRLNGEIVTLGQISAAARHLADIHGQYDNQSLLNPEYHIELLDAYGHDEIESLKENVSKIFSEYSKCRSSLLKLLSSEKEDARKADFYRYEVNEIKNAGLIPGEDEELGERISLLQNSEKIFENVSRAYAALYGEASSATDGLSAAVKSIEQVAPFSKDLQALSEEVSDIYYRLDDVCTRLREVKDSINFSPSELDTAFSRMSLIDGLKKKYGSTIEEIIDYCNKTEALLSASENASENKAELMRSLKELKSNLASECALLTEARKAKALELEKAIQDELQDLNFKEARVKIDIQPLSEPSSGGADKVEILMTANRGETLKPLYKIASGGEMSRIMLAFKNIISAYDDIPTLIFDEIDSGISGITASVVGTKLKEISEQRQIICITHLPQIAARGDFNYRIYKETEGDETCTYIEPLNEEEKVMEIARLLGGSVITDATIKNARELINT